jgi:hypothetical protein
MMQSYNSGINFHCGILGYDTVRKWVGGQKATGLFSRNLSSITDDFEGFPQSMCPRIVTLKLTLPGSYVIHLYSDANIGPGPTHRVQFCPCLPVLTETRPSVR